MWNETLYLYDVHNESDILTVIIYGEKEKKEMSISGGWCVVLKFFMLSIPNRYKNVSELLIF